MTRLAFGLVLLLLPATTASQDVRSIQGTILDNRTNAPLRGARVQIPGDTSVLTDDRGRFTLGFVSTTPVQMVHVAKPGFARATFMMGPAPGQLVIRMRQGGTLTIRLFDEFNEPKRGTVSLTSLPDTGTMMATMASLNDLGELRVPNLAAGRYQLRIGGVLGQLLRLPTDLDPSDVPQLRETIRALGASQPPNIGLSDTIVEVRAGEETVLSMVDAAPPLERPVISVTSDNATLVEDGHVSGRTGTAVLRGRVTQTDGRPIAGVRVTVGTEGSMASVATDRDGRYAFEGLPGGRFRMSATKAGFMPMTVGSVPVAAGQTVVVQDGEALALDVQLSPASVLAGQVLDEFGDPLQQAKVLVLRVPPETEPGPPRPVARAQTDERGHYQVRGVPPGAYYLFTDGELTFPGEVHQFYPASLSLAAAQVVHVEAGLNLDDLTMRVDRSVGARLSGMALDAQGMTAAGRTVQMTGTDASGAAVIPRVARTNRSGSFEFRNVSPGDYEIAYQTANTPAALIPALLGWTPPPSTAAAISGSVAVRVRGSTTPPVTLRASP